MRHVSSPSHHYPIKESCRNEKYESGLAVTTHPLSSYDLLEAPISIIPPFTPAGSADRDKAKPVISAFSFCSVEKRWSPHLVNTKTIHLTWSPHGNMAMRS